MRGASFCARHCVVVARSDPKRLGDDVAQADRLRPVGDPEQSRPADLKAQLGRASVDVDCQMKCYPDGRAIWAERLELYRVASWLGDRNVDDRPRLGGQGGPPSRRAWIGAPPESSANPGPDWLVSGGGTATSRKAGRVGTGPSRARIVHHCEQLLRVRDHKRPDS